nr:porin [uncultured Duganella sp.]
MKNRRIPRPAIAAASPAAAGPLTVAAATALTGRSAERAAGLAAGLCAVLAAVLAAAPALAQSQPAAGSSVSVYGIADIGVVGERGGAAGNVTKLTSGPASASRIGFKGSEDLGGGLSAFFILEAGYSLDTGGFASANTLFNRLALVGLRGGAGSVSVGRQATPYHNTLVAVADPFGTGYAGTIKNAFPDWGTNVRASNTVIVATPDLNGFAGDLFYSPGEQPGSADAGRQTGASFGYASARFNVRLAYNHKNADTAATPDAPAVRRGAGSNKLLAANYDFGAARLFAAVGVDRGFNSAPLGNTGNPYGGVAPTASTDGREALLGVSVPLSSGTLMASLMRKDDRTRFNQDARTWGVGYVHPLSRRTSLYAAYGSIANRNGAGYTVANNTEAGSGDRAYNLGLRHSF